MSADLLAGLVRATLALSAAIAIILALRAPLRAMFGARVAYAFWALAPIALVASLLPARTIILTAPVTSVAADAIANPAAQPASQVLNAASDAGAAIVASIAFDPSPYLIALWLLGFVASLMLLLVAQQRFLAGIGARRADGVHVAATDHVGPAVVGLVAPRIIVPADFEARYNAEERGLVLEHERAHIRAGDVQVNALAALLQCLNWFNPLIYVARAALRVDQELACDERVMAQHGHARRVYAEAMLKTQLAASAVPLGCAWPPIGARPLKQRIAMLGRAQPARAQRILGGALCGLAIAVMGVAVWAAQPPRSAYAEANERNGRGGSPFLGARLVQALQDGEQEQARELIESGADVNYWTPGDGTPLVIAARDGDSDMARLLIEAGADVNKGAHGDGNPLIMASANGDLDIVALLVNAGADVNGFVSGDETPLIRAAWNNEIAVARYLIENGADANLAVDAPTTRGVERRSPLIMARQRGHTQMIALLRAAGAHD
jgi:beta-lactamase regulating signal transducer with metallopeptidase domain